MDIRHHNSWKLIILNGILCHERDLKIKKRSLSANPANIFERFEARRQEDLNLRPLA